MPSSGSGDSLWSISHCHNTTVARLIRDNQIRKVDLIFPASG